MYQVFGASTPVGQRHNRERGEDHPIGTETVTAPATVSGKGAATSLGNREDAATARAASQETCRTADFDQPVSRRVT